jgi:hypothetical protein
MLGPHWYRCFRADPLALIDRGPAFEEAVMRYPRLKR